MPFTLFLDDLEVVHEPAVLGLVREIVEQLPRRGQLVIGSRGLPDLGLGRLRARGQLIEIDTDRLRFSLEETSAFFGLRTSPTVQALPIDMLSQLHRKTEGWVAAIWLASMALERHGIETGFVERFSGSDRAVAEYLAEDLLAHQPAEIREFLLRTSILRQHDLDYLALAKARWEIAFGDARAALTVLDAEIHAAVTSKRNRRVLKLRVLRAMALQRVGELAAAVEEIGAVLQAASHEGFMRLILDEGPAVGGLVQRYANAAMQEAAGTAASPSARGDPILADYLQRLLQAMGPMAPVDAEAAPTDDAIREALTRKEIRVLQLLAEGYSNSAMAEKIFVSDSTVRTHLRNINMKLDAKSRTQAVAIARRFGMIR